MREVTIGCWPLMYKIEENTIILNKPKNNVQLLNLQATKLPFATSATKGWWLPPPEV